MFISDNPIQTKEEDILDRGNFVEHLSSAILEQGKSESIVIALCGEWGSGKSSIVNLVIKNIEVRRHEKKPIIIRFNPWVFSEKRGLTERFFNEIANNIDSGSAKLIRKYGAILSNAPEIGAWVQFAHNVIEGSEPETKERIKKNISGKQKRMLIVIDDIDRLNQSEIKETFQIIKANADFPNTIYLLTFDRKVVEKNLSDGLQKGSGKDYMDKIVQIDFDVPVANKAKILHYFVDRLNYTLDKLPEKSAKKHFPENDLRWQKIYHSGFTNFFKNIRDVKRYINSLEFNLSQMHQNDVMEVNPIDFIAIEAIRVFAPDFYLFMKNRKTLFTSILSGTEEKEKQVKEIENAAKKLFPKEVKESVLELIKILFPQIFSNYTHDYYENNSSKWRKDLRVHSEQKFDIYFTLIPGGGEDELSQFEIEKILNSASSAENLEKILREYIEKGKIEKVLRRIGDFMNEEKMIPSGNVNNMVKAFLNISDDLHASENTFDMWSMTYAMPVILHCFLGREVDKDKNLKTLKEIIISSKALFGPLEQIASESTRKQEDSIIPEGEIKDLQKLCVKRIQEFGFNNLLKHKDLDYIMYRWQEWGKEEEWKKFVKGVQEDETKSLDFISKFIIRTTIITGYNEPYSVSVRKEISYKRLSTFLDLEKLKTKLEEIKELDSDSYKNNQEIIDMYLDDFDQKIMTNKKKHETSA